jgi:uncharacterized membrane protein YedE/YeeE
MQPDIRNLQTWATGLLAGLLFTAGLVWSGMTDPAKVIGFLNVAALFTDQVPGAWDASLAFVMGGAVAVTLLAFSRVPTTNTHDKPWLAYAFQLPTRTDIDVRLLTGTACFGIGWGLGGFCPGPALSAVLVNTDLLWFLPAMGLGMWVATTQHAGA